MHHFAIVFGDLERIGREEACLAAHVLHAVTVKLVLEHFDFGLLVNGSPGGAPADRPTPQQEVRRLLERLAEEAADSGDPTPDLAETARLAGGFLGSPRAAVPGRGVLGPRLSPPHRKMPLPSEM